MADEPLEPIPMRSHWEERRWRRRQARAAGPMGAMYFLGFIGALVYYIQTATSFGAGLLGIVKALFWPAFLVYDALRAMHG